MRVSVRRQESRFRVTRLLDRDEREDEEAAAEADEERQAGTAVQALPSPGEEPFVSIVELAEAMAAMQKRREGRERPIVGREAILRAAQGLWPKVVTYDEVEAELRTRRVFTSVELSPENRNASISGQRRRRPTSRKLEKERKQRQMRLAYMAVFGIVVVLLAGYTFWQRPSGGDPLPTQQKKPTGPFKPDMGASVRDPSGRKTLAEVAEGIPVRIGATDLFRVMPIEDAAGMPVEGMPGVTAGEWIIFKRNGGVYLRGWLEEPTSKGALVTNGARIASSDRGPDGRLIGTKPTLINLRADAVRATVGHNDISPGGVLNWLTIKRVSEEGILSDK
jgi:hypothetical protein